MAKHLSTLPMRLGGLGLRSAVRTAPAAHWASVGDALGMIEERLPAAACVAVELLSRQHDGEQLRSGLDEARAAGELLSREGFLL